MGMMVWQVSWSKFNEGDDVRMTHSWIFVFVVIIILIFGRFLNVYVMEFLFSKINNKFSISFQEKFILFVSGLVRGATPFALFTSVSLVNKT